MRGAYGRLDGATLAAVCELLRPAADAGQRDAAAALLLTLAGAVPEVFRGPDALPAVVALLTETGLAARTGVHVLALVTAPTVPGAAGVPPAVARALRKTLAAVATRAMDAAAAAHALRALVQLCGPDSLDLAATFTVRLAFLGSGYLAS